MTDTPRGNPEDRGTLLTPRRVTAGILALLATTFVIQNRDEVILQFLGIRVTAALWFTSLAPLVLGIAIGALLTSRRSSR